MKKPIKTTEAIFPMPVLLISTFNDCFDLATGTENKELFIVQGARHIPTYFVPEFVDQEANKLIEFFGKYL